MRLAVQEIDAAHGVSGRPLALDIHDDAGEGDRATQLVGEALDRRPPAILYVGPGPALSPLRARFEQAGTPVVLLSGDLYMGRALFPQVFQTTIPWEWQAHVIARYLVVDRKADRMVFAGAGPEAKAAAGATRAAVAYWGGKVEDVVTIPAGGALDRVISAARGASALIDFGSSSDADRIARAVAGLPKPPRIAGPPSLLAATPRPAPGTVACYTYTWAGWAQPITRVAAFRTAFATMTGHGTAGLEQEGYDAVRILSRTLRTTGLAGGPDLVAQLETIHNLAYSSFPLDFGPDDHMFLPRDQLGLFAVAGPQERVDPWQIPGSEPWRALMRTFTYDGRRTSVLDSDRTAFFPFWNKYQPGPNYWRSIYGITSKPKRDPLH